MTPDTEQLRRHLMATGFDVRAAAAGPMEQFQRWFAEARAANLPLPHAMTLATVGANGRPSARMVLMTGAGQQGLVYYTDDRSPKAVAAAESGWVAVVFNWAGLERQVRLEGQVEPITAAEADAQWATRPWPPQVAAWVAPQSAVVASRAELEERLLQLMAQYEHQPVPRPPHYRGFRIRPAVVEFWQGRDDRLHDRIRYRQDDSTWVIERLAP